MPAVSELTSMRAQDTRGHPLETHAALFYSQKLLSARTPRELFPATSDLGRCAILILEIETRLVEPQRLHMSSTVMSIGED